MGCGVENSDAMAVNDVPAAVRLGMNGRTFIQQTRQSVLQRAIDDITMACNPANVSSTPEHILVFGVEHYLSGVVSADRIASGGVQNTFGFASGTRGVEQKQRMF